MKTVNYRLQTEIEHLSPASQKDWFKNYLKEILESDKPYYQKSDYIALSFLEIDKKLAYIGSEIKQLTELKKKLTQAKTLGLEIAANILQDYGIDKMEGTVVSSLTIAPPKTKIRETIHYKNPNKIMELGYISFSVDEKAVKEALKTKEGFDELDPYIQVDIEEEEIPSKLKINKRRSNNTEPVSTTELLEAA